MKVCVIDSKGRVLQTMELSAEAFEKYTSREGTYVIGVSPDNLSDYWNGDSFVSIGAQPSRWHSFDYTTKAWTDSRTLNDLKTQKWVTLKAQREAFEFGGFSYGGNMYDSDQVSQGRILGAAMANTDLTWTLQNNESIELSANELKELFVAMQAHIALTHERGRLARLALDAATTTEEIEAIQL